MAVEPQPGGPDRLDRALQQLKVIWFGLFAGATVITALAVAVVFSNEAPIADLGELAYLFLLAVPFGLLGAFVLVPGFTPKDPAEVVRTTKAAGARGFEGWDKAKPDDAFYWYPAYMPGFLVRAGVLEGSAILCAIGFLISSNWAVLGGALVMIAALAVQAPTRGKVEAFAESARARRPNAW